MSLELEVGIDLERTGPITFTLTETGGGGATGAVTISTGTGFLRTSAATITDPDGESFALGYADILTAIKNELENVGNATYTVTFSTSTQRITISASGGGVTSFAISSPSTWTGQLLGWNGATKSGALTYEMDVAPYRWIQCSEGGLSAYPQDREHDRTIAEDMIAHSGDVYQIAEEAAPVEFDALVPLEAAALVWNDFASASTPYTWQRAFKDLRGGEVACLYWNDGTVNKRYFFRLRAEGSRFRPELRTRDWWGVADVPIKAWLLGRA